MDELDDHTLKGARRAVSSRSPLFRPQALDYYIHRREQTIFPRLARPPVLLLLWMLLSLAGLALGVAWFAQVPVYLTGNGIVLEQTMLHQGQVVQTAVALVFLPVAPAPASPLRVGAVARLQIGAQGQPFTTTVAAVEPGILGPDEIQRRYASLSRVSRLVTGPSRVVSITLGPAFAAPVYAGSLLTAQIQVGSTSVLSFLFGQALAVGG